MTRGGRVRVRAHAKLTLALRVVGRRSDGFHDLDGLAVSLAHPSDEVDVALSDGPGVSLEMAGLTEGVPGDEANLAVRAARSILDRAPSATGAAIRLYKGIPAGAGLGGGSADAAAVLDSLVRLLPGGAEELDLDALGAELGSDVPFCLRGGLAWLRGRGERVEPAGEPGEWWVVVAVPPFALATADVYRAWDDLGGPAGERRAPAPPPLAGFVESLVNDLEPAALESEPRLAAFRHRLEEVAMRPPVLAGSGSAYFVVAQNEREARFIAEEARAFSALTVASRPSPGGVTLTVG